MGIGGQLRRRRHERRRYGRRRHGNLGAAGSFGWHHGDKVVVKVGNTLVKCQVGLTQQAKPETKAKLEKRRGEQDNGRDLP